MRSRSASTCHCSISSRPSGGIADRGIVDPGSGPQVRRAPQNGARSVVLGLAGPAPQAAAALVAAGPVQTLRQVEAAYAAFGKMDGNAQLPPKEQELVDSAHREAFAAMSLIKLAGPEHVRKAARELWTSGDVLVSSWGFPRASADPSQGDAYQRHQAALKAFRLAARGALGYDDAVDLQVPAPDAGRPLGDGNSPG